MIYQNIIFLDVDGVFNCELHWQSIGYKSYKEANKTLKKKIKSKEIQRLDYYKSKICPDRIKWFNQLCEDTKSVVVISSTWRKNKTIEDIREIFKYAGASFHILDKTGVDPCRIRGVEIYQWLKDNSKKCFDKEYEELKNEYVIIDDDSDMLLWQQYNFFKTDGYSGLTPNICYRIKRFLS